MTYRYRLRREGSPAVQPVLAGPDGVRDALLRRVGAAAGRGAGGTQGLPAGAPPGHRRGVREPGQPDPGAGPRDHRDVPAGPGDPRPGQGPPAEGPRRPRVPRPAPAAPVRGPEAEGRSEGAAAAAGAAPLEARGGGAGAGVHAPDLALPEHAGADPVRVPDPGRAGHALLHRQQHPGEPHRGEPARNGRHAAVRPTGH